MPPPSRPRPGHWRREAREAQARLEQLVASSSDAIVLLDPAGNVSSTNPAFSELTGIPADAAVGHPLDHVLVPLRPEPTGEGHLRLRHLVDGSVRTVRRSPAADDDAVAGGVVTFTDVTRQRAVAALKADFVARVSHELRTPLTPIAGFARMLLARSATLDEKSRAAALERIIERADHLASLVDDLLQVAELQDPGTHRPDTRPVDLRRAIGWALADTESNHPGRTVRSALQDDTATAAVLAWPEGLISILGHLVDNALRYSPPGTEVDVVARRPAPGLVEVAVSDRGRGIPIADREAVFSAFHRLDDPLHMTTSGIGVGLFIARKLARRMGGDVTCRSHPGPGITFAVTLRTERSLVPQSDTRTLRRIDQRRILQATRNLA